MSKLTSKGAVLALVAVAALLSWHTAAEPGTGAEKAAFPATLGEPAGASAADNWPQFRGPGGLGIAEDAGVPRSWSETENIVWKAEIEGLGHSSPVIWGDTIFLTTALEGETIPGAGSFIDAATGDVVYQGGRIPVPASMLMSSLLVVDGKIMLSTPEGDTFWIATGPEFSIAGHNSLDEPILTTPAIVGGMIYLRGRTHLYAIGSVDNEP